MQSISHGFDVVELENIDLNLLPTLHALLEEESVTRAANRLGLSTPAVSHALGRLRDSLGDPVLVRAGRKMVPSPRAVALRPRVAALLDEARSVFDPTGGFDPRTSTREFLIHASDYIILVLGPALDRIARTQGPGIRLQFMPNTVGDPDLVREGEADLAIGVYGNIHPEIRIQKLFEEEFVCVVRAGNPGVRKRLSAQQFAALPHIQIAPRGRPGGIVDDALEAMGLQRTVARRVPFFFGALSMTAQTDYVLTLPRRLAEAHAHTFGLRTFNLPLGLDPYPIRQIWHPRNEGDPGHRWLRETVLQAAQPRRRPRSA